MAALFGIIYREKIKASGGAAEIARQAGIDNVNVNLGCRLAAYVTTDDGVRERFRAHVDSEVDVETAADYGNSAPSWSPDDEQAVSSTEYTEDIEPLRREIQRRRAVDGKRYPPCPDCGGRVVWWGVRHLRCEACGSLFDPSP